MDTLPAADPSTAPETEQTFRTYSKQQAETYQAARGSYNTALINNVLDFHKSTGGAFDTLIDVGAGPGNATRALAPAFNVVVGVDPAPAMSETARTLGGRTKTGDEICYVTAQAEKCDELSDIAEGSVDMITAAMAVHWFDLSAFWAAAARALKPGGTVAVWTCASLYAHPSQPNAEKIQAILSHLEDDILGPYALPGNRISRSGYETLIMPWDLPETNPAQDTFGQAASVRRDWNKDGACAIDEDFFDGTTEHTLPEAEASLGTASMVTRWREAHPELANTDKDCVRKTFKEIERHMDDATTLKLGSWTVLLMLKKKT